MQIDFNETVKVFDLIPGNAYGGEVLDSGHDCEALVEFGTGFGHGNNQDAISSGTHLYLKNNSWLESVKNRIEGLIVLVNPFGNDDEKEYYRITEVQVGRDVLLGNEIHHFECDVEKTTDFSGITVS